MNNRIESIFLICIVIIGLFPTNIVINGKAEFEIQSSTNILLPHNPISIKNNDQFIKENGVVSGNGTKTNPYIIEYWDINASTNHGIQIGYTTAYFIIRNCNIYNGRNNESKYTGILLYYVSNGVIENCTITHNDRGILLYECTNICIKNCDAINNTNGICFKYSSQNTIINCITYSNIYCGIAFTLASNNNSITNCISHSNKRGCGVYFSSNNSITSSTLYDNYIGIDLNEAKNGQITCNNISNNIYGFDIGFDCFNNLIYHNNIINNTYNIDSYLNNNRWDKGYQYGGNYWGENYSCDMYSGWGYMYLRVSGRDGIYDGVVNVSGGVKDNYPLAQPMNIPLPEVVVTDIKFSGRYFDDEFYLYTGDTIKITATVYNRNYVNMCKVNLHFFDDDKLICIQPLNFSDNKIEKNVVVNWSPTVSSIPNRTIKIKVFQVGLTDEKYSVFYRNVSVHHLPLFPTIGFLPICVGIGCILMGIILYLSDKKKSIRKISKSINFSKKNPT